MTGLSKEDAFNLRDDDIVLVPMRVERSNHHFSPAHGVTLHLHGPFFDLRQNSEKLAKPHPPAQQIGTNRVQAVQYRRLRVDDRVQFQHHIYPDAKGRITHIDTDIFEATVRLEDPPKDGPQSVVKSLKDLTRILTKAQRDNYRLDGND